MDYQMIYDAIKLKCPNFENAPPPEIDRVLNLTEYQIQQIIEVVSYFYDAGEEKLAKEILNDIYRGKSGILYEAMIYGFLVESKIQFYPQPLMSSDDCLKKSKYKPDGQIEKVNPVFFDVKQFGIGATHLDGEFYRKLQDRYPNYIVSIGGQKSISTSDVESKLLSKFDEITREIELQMNDFSFADFPFAVTPANFDKIKLQFTPRSRHYAISISELDISEWAEANRFYFLRDGSQFCTNNPYIIFCPFDERLDFNLAHQKPERVHLQLRFLCRRVFVELARIKDRYLTEFDGKAKDKITVSTASKKISAIVFMDVTNQCTYNTQKIWAFINPNADNPLYRYQIDSWFRNNGAWIDDFAHDNY